MAATIPTRAFSIVVAATPEGGIGINNKLPWHLPREMAYFRDLTSKTKEPSAQNAVIMGRNTWESIPLRFRPLANRLNIVLTTSGDSSQFSGATVCKSFGAALDLLAGEDADKIEKTFVVGGSRVYKEALDHPQCENVYLTRILSPSFECDTFFPSVDSSRYELDESYSNSVEEEKGVTYKYLRYARKNNVAQSVQTSNKTTNVAVDIHEEMQYLNLVKHIIEHGNSKGDRTGTGTRSVFGAQMRFNLRGDVFPLLTTKFVWWKGIAEELLWFMAGSTNANTLSEKKVRIWDANATKEFLTKRGLGHRDQGDLGPVYGFQWRHFGAKYIDMHTDYTGQGVDQLAQCIELIKKDPDSRRIVMSAWNPQDLDLMALPPCHMFCQFYVFDGELSCQMYQRSADMGLGVPFNIASYALLTRLIAHVCGLKPGDFVHSIGDAHVYNNHIEGLTKQLSREPHPFPTLTLDPTKRDIDQFTFADLSLQNYVHHPKIDLPFAV